MGGGTGGGDSGSTTDASVLAGPASPRLHGHAHIHIVVETTPSFTASLGPRKVPLGRTGRSRRANDGGRTWENRNAATGRSPPTALAPTMRRPESIHQEPCRNGSVDKHARRWTSVVTPHSRSRPRFTETEVPEGPVARTSRTSTRDASHARGRKRSERGVQPGDPRRRRRRVSAAPRVLATGRRSGRAGPPDPRTAGSSSRRSPRAGGRRTRTSYASSWRGG